MDRKIVKKVPLILASASPRRHELLKQLRRPFRVIASAVDETSAIPNPRKRVEALARRKAEFIAQRHPDAIVIGADTLVVLDGKILGKPKDARHAYQMLYRLSGSRHQVVTGVAIVHLAAKKRKIASALSTVRMRKMEIEELLRYSRKHLDKAGAYAIQEKNDPVATLVSGSYDNVVGLPMALVKKMLVGFK